MQRRPEAIWRELWGCTISSSKSTLSRHSASQLCARMYWLSTSEITLAIVAASGTSTSIGSPPGIDWPKMRICICFPLPPPTASMLPPLRSVESAEVPVAPSAMIGTASRVMRKLSSASAKKTTLRSLGGAVSWGRGGTPVSQLFLRPSEPPRPRGGSSSSEFSSEEGGRLSGLVLSRWSSSRSSRSDAACTYARTTNSRASGDVRSISQPRGERGRDWARVSRTGNNGLGISW